MLYVHIQKADFFVPEVDVIGAFLNCVSQEGNDPIAITLSNFNILAFIHRLTNNIWVSECVPA